MGVGRLLGSQQRRQDHGDAGGVRARRTGRRNGVLARRPVCGRRTSQIRVHARGAGSVPEDAAAGPAGVSEAPRLRRRVRAACTKSRSCPAACKAPMSSAPNDWTTARPMSAAQREGEALREVDRLRCVIWVHREWESLELGADLGPPALSRVEVALSIPDVARVGSLQC